jgi:hypothetical protein
MWNLGKPQVFPAGSSSPRVPECKSPVWIRVAMFFGELRQSIVPRAVRGNAELSPNLLANTIQVSTTDLATEVESA